MKLKIKGFGMNEQEEKWQWMMDYCKKNKIPPAQKWAWDKAEEAYNEYNTPRYVTREMALDAGDIKLEGTEI